MNPMENAFIDIHSHQGNQFSGLRISNVGKELLLPDDPEGLFTMGIHPWYIDQLTVESALQQISIDAQRKEIVAIGECGIDRLIQTPIKLQEEIFRRQILIAEKTKKPMIIHCVKAFPEIIRIRKEMNAQSPWILHGYNNNEQIGEELIKHGFHLSFGKALLQKGSNAQKMIVKCPVEKLFLETDTGPASIEEIYKAASDLKQIGMEALKNCIQKNFNSLFPEYERH